MSEIAVERLKINTETGESAWQHDIVKVNDHVDFTINDELIEADMCRLGQLLCTYGDLQAETKSTLARKEEELKQIYAQEALNVREMLRKAGEKSTESIVNETVLVSFNYTMKQAEVQLARSVAYRCENWWRSIQKKADLIQSLAYRQGAELKRL
jgi:hypothetical protein